MPKKRKRPNKPQSADTTPGAKADAPPRHEPFRALLAQVDVPAARPPEARHAPPVEPAPAPPLDPLDDPDVDEATLLEEAFAGVAPLAGHHAVDRPLPTPPPQAPRPGSAPTAPLEDTRRLADIFEAEADTAMGLRWVASGVDPKLATQLADGLFVPTRRLDVHGHDEASAVRAARRFVEAEADRGTRCVALIHGRGRHSIGPPVLGPAIRAALRMMSTRVDAWAVARREAGGEGVTLVLLARR